MIGDFQADTPSVGIFWLVEIAPGRSTILTAGCSLASAEAYGDFLTFPDGHYEVWSRWQETKDRNPALGALVREYEYEDWPRGRIVFDGAKKHFTLYADRKLISAEMIAKIRDRFLLPGKRTEIETDFHYQSRETPGLPI